MSTSSTSSSTSNSTTTSTTRSSLLVTLRASDGVTLLVEEAAAEYFEFIKNMLRDGYGVGGSVISLPKVDSETLRIMLEWCKKHAESAVDVDDMDAGAAKQAKAKLKNWDDRFVEDLDQGTLYDLLTGADFLAASEELIDLFARRVADLLKDKTADEIRREFNIENDFTPQEEESIRNRNEHAFNRR